MVVARASIWVMGRLSTFTEEKAAEICERLSKGEPLAVICRDEGMPETRTVYDWRDAHPEFAAGFARARDVGFDVIATDCMDISDSASNDWMEKNDPNNPGYVANGDHIQRSKLRVDTRLKLLAKWDPRRYGERLDIGNADNKPFQSTNTDAEALKRLTTLTTKIAERAGVDVSDLV